MNINISLVGQAITFLIFVAFTMKYVWPPIVSAINEREKKIADGLEAARKGEQSLLDAGKETKVILQNAKHEAQAIIEKSNKLAATIIEEAKAQAKLEAKKVLESAKTEIEQEKQKAKEELRLEIAKVAILGAQKILERNIEEKDHSNMLEQLAANI